MIKFTKEFIHHCYVKARKEPILNLTEQELTELLVTCDGMGEEFKRQALAELITRAKHDSQQLPR